MLDWQMIILQNNRALNPLKTQGAVLISAITLPSNTPKDFVASAQAGSNQTSG
jgi:hypothetical protein